MISKAYVRRQLDSSSGNRAAIPAHKHALGELAVTMSAEPSIHHPYNPILTSGSRHQGQPRTCEAVHQKLPQTITAHSQSGRRKPRPRPMAQPLPPQPPNQPRLPAQNRTKRLRMWNGASSNVSIQAGSKVECERGLNMSKANRHEGRASIGRQALTAVGLRLLSRSVRATQFSHACCAQFIVTCPCL